MRNFAIIGAAGSLGTAICELLERSPSVGNAVAIDLSENGLAKLARVYGVPCHLADLADTNRILRILDHHQCDVVVNCAALKHVGSCEQNPERAIEINVLANLRLVDQLPTPGNFAFISSDKAEDPVNVYALTKRMTEHVLLRRGCQVITGVNFFLSHGSVLDVWEAQRVRHVPFTVVRQTCIRYFIHLDDIAALTIQAFDNSGARHHPKIVYEVEIHELLRSYLTVRNGGAEAPKMFFDLPSSEKAREDLAFPAQVVQLKGEALDEILRDLPWESR